MIRALMPVCAVAAIISLSGCGIGGYMQPSGLFPSAGIYMETTSGGIIYDNGTTPTKTGKACGTGILGIIATGDTSVEAAMKNGGIQKVVFTEQYIKYIVWGVYSEVCTIVKGN